MKWNGPHDQEFFRCFEQYLDEAIKKFVDQDKKQEILTKETPMGLFNKEHSPQSTTTEECITAQLG
jgi:hypothetical protein